MIKRKGKNQIENLIPDQKSLESKGQMRFNWDILYSIGKIFLRAIRYFPCIFKIDRFEKDMNVQSFGTIKVPILGFHLGVLRKNDIWM
jgi:hypothetical protein